MEVAKCEALQETRKLRPEKEELRRTKQIFQILPRQYIRPFWEECRRLLNAAIVADHQELRVFKGFKLFCNAKNLKEVVCEWSGNLRNLVNKLSVKG